MSNITLTDADVHDLRAGATINAMADDGSEHVISSADMTNADINAMESGAELFVGPHRVSYPD